MYSEYCHMSYDKQLIYNLITSLSTWLIVKRGLWMHLMIEIHDC